MFTFNAVKEAAGYIQAGTDSKATDLEVVRGSLQEKPKLFDHSIEQLEDLADWMKLHAQGAAPWVARVHVNGPDLPRGSWEVLSSEAFLTVPLQWYVLLSAGTLRPIVKEVHIHPTGLGAPGAGSRPKYVHGLAVWVSLTRSMAGPEAGRSPEPHEQTEAGGCLRQGVPAAPAFLSEGSCADLQALMRPALQITASQPRLKPRVPRWLGSRTWAGRWSSPRPRTAGRPQP